MVVSAEYQKRKGSFSARKNTTSRADDDDDVDQGDIQNIGDAVKLIVMDETSFWPELVQILRVTYPIVTLLRLMDSNKPCLGKVYHEMCQVAAHIESSSVSWKDEAKKIHTDRWEYLHSPFHGAAYALDPQFMMVVQDIDEHCEKGFTTVLERLCIRDVILEKGLDVSTTEKRERTLTSINARHRDVVMRVAQGEREFEAYKQMKAPFNRPSVQLNSTIMDPHAWWNTYGTHLYPSFRV